MADEAKAKGNAAFSAGNFTDAVRHFTDAINLAPNNHVLYSNRSAAYASLNQYSEALTDAKNTVDLKPDLAKGYSRLGAAHHGLKQYDDAVLAYKKGLEVDPNNETLKSGLKDAESASVRPRGQANNLFGDAFGPDMWAKLTADPATRLYMQQLDFVNMMKELQRDPSSLNLYLQDQRIMQAISVLLNVKMQAYGTGDDVEMPDSEPKERKQPVDETDMVKEEKREVEPEPEPEQMDVSEEREIKERKMQAQKEKEAGNAAYKKKGFKNLRSSKFNVVIAFDPFKFRGEPSAKRSKTSSSNEPQSQGSEARCQINLNDIEEDLEEQHGENDPFEPPQRPVGRDRVKKVAQSSSSGVRIDYTETFEKVINKLDSLLQMTKERLNLKKEHGDRKLKLKESRQKARDLQILTTDTTNLSGAELALAEQIKQEIREKYNL